MKKSSTAVGSLTILLNFDLYRVQGARLTIPLLAIDQDIGQFTQFESIPTGVYDGILITYLTSGEEYQQKIKLKILANKGNFHTFHLTGRPQEVIIRPVDSNDKPILFAEVQIQSTDLNFRPVRDEKGVAYRLHPGEYEVKVILPNLRMKTFPLKVTDDVNVYTLAVDGKHSETRREKRFQLSIPADYRINEGKWISTKTINISSAGICLVKRDWQLDDENMVLRLFLPMSANPLECRARVRWVKDEGEDAAEMGLELFLSAALKSSLKKWLADNKTKDEESNPTV
jgi:PilZ domain.